jgi:hypothetical protein
MAVQTFILISATYIEYTKSEQQLQQHAARATGREDNMKTIFYSSLCVHGLERRHARTVRRIIHQKELVVKLNLVCKHVQRKHQHQVMHNHLVLQSRYSPTRVIESAAERSLSH